MRSPDFPPQELLRLAELRGLGVLDTPPEERFDRYTRLARQLFKVEIALVSLVDANRQWFKSCQGLDATETGRDISFCGHAVLVDELFLIEDTSLDERFADNPLVTGAPHIRFYAGQPLRSLGGQCIGTLCIIDSQPRALLTEERQALLDLARAVEQELNTRDISLLAQHARQGAQRLAAVLDNMHEAVVSVDAQGVVRGGNRNAHGLFGYAAGGMEGLVINQLLPAFAVSSLPMARVEAQAVGRRQDGSELPLALTLEPLSELDQAGWTCIARDLSGHHAALEMQAQFAAIIESSDDAIVSLSLDGLITSWNPAAERVYGYSKEEAVGQSVLMLVPPTLTDQAQRLLDRVAAGERVQHTQTQRVSRNWTQINVSMSLAPLRNTHGAVVGAAEITRDISDQHKVGEQLRESEDRYQLAMRGSNAGLWDWNIESDEAYFSPRLCAMLGHDANGLGLHFSALTRALHADDDERFRRALDEHLSGRQMSFALECRLQTRANEYRWFSLRGEALRNGMAMPYRMAGSLIDVHERMQAQAALQGTTAMLQSVLDAATGVAIIAMDTDGIITVFNRGAEKLLGYGAEELVGKFTPAVFLEPDDLARRRRRRAEILPTHGGAAGAVEAARLALSQIEEVFFRRKDGSRVRVSRIVSDRIDAQGHVIGRLGLAYDVTQQWEYEESLREARAKAEQASVAKSQFLANMSHELRTPMNAILGMLQLLSATALAPRQADYVKKTDCAARSLLHLLNDILDFSKVEAGKMELDAHPFSLDHLVRDLAVIVSGAVGPKPVAVRFEIDPRIPHALEGDGQRLRQVLVNLLGNAIKFTQQGEVVLSMALAHESELDIEIDIAVRDTGIGIAPEHRERIFLGFTQAEGSTTRRYGGTGLGLAISQRLIQLMGTSFVLESELGRGSRFAFKLRLKRGDPALLAEPAVGVHPNDGTPLGKRLAGMRLLVVEDNLNNQQVAQELLEGEGAQVQLACDGAVAITALQDAPDHFDAVLMDLQMPVMDGLSATRVIRQTLGLKTLPVIAMTANAMESDRAACLEAGMNDHVGKPFDLGHLVGLLLRLTGHASHAAAPEAVSEPAAGAVPPEMLVAAAERGIDLRNALLRMGGQPKPYARMLASFLKDLPSLPDELAADLAQRRHPDAARRLHSLKGLAATLGVMALSRYAGAAEKRFKGLADGAEGADVGIDPRELLAGLRAAVDQGAQGLGWVAQQLSAHAARSEPAQAVARPESAGERQALLGDLAGLLAQSDMRALDVFGELGVPAQAQARADHEALDQALNALDFAVARVHCQALLALETAAG